MLVPPAATPLVCRHSSEAIRSAVIAVECVVVVDIARSVDIPRIVRVATIRRTQPAVTSFQPTSLRYIIDILDIV